MARPNNTTEAYQELLTPVKDPEQSFAINISELLQSYVRNFIHGSVPGNFNSAALMIQGSSSIYGKKVEYLHNLATKLYASLVKHRKEDGGTKKDTKEREKHHKENKFSDPFCSTEIKLGKNLSCLRKKFMVKNAANKKASKKSDKKFTYIPVDLLPVDGDKKGREFFDTLGHKVGCKNEFTLNKCKVSSSGWLLLPTVSSDMIPSQFSSPDYTFEDEHSDDDVCNDIDAGFPEPSPDEGYPPSSGCSETPPASLPSSQIPSSQETDEGLGSLPCTPQETESTPQSASGTTTEGPSQAESNDNTPSANVSPTETPMEGIQGPDVVIHGAEGIENIPLENADVGPRPRRSTRQALKICQIQEDGAPNQSASVLSEKEDATVIKKAIQKKNTCNLPTKLKTNNGTKLRPAAEFCARTFFAMDRKFRKNSFINIGVKAFQKNSDLLEKIRKIQAALLVHNKNKKERANVLTAEDDEDDDGNDNVLMDIEDVELDLIDPVTNDDIVIPPLEASDIIIENNPVLSAPVFNDENPLAEEEPMFIGDDGGFLSPFDSDDADNSFANAAKLQCALFKEDLQQYVQTSDISKRVHEWEANMKPFLKKLNQREEFDINLYGSHILSAFKDSNRKQTMTFRDFCKGKSKWQIHRYFMALLPLVNIGNVNIEAEKLDDGGEDILITLLSRKMHHKELEEFGHTEGEHT